jgi:hypothetical protein
MDRTKFTELLERSHQRELALNNTKGKDYAGDEDALRNFKEAAAELGLTPEQVLGVYLHKHYAAIRSYIENGSVASEPIQGRIDDARLYLALLQGLVEESGPKKRGRKAKAVTADPEPEPVAQPVEPVADKPTPRPRRTSAQVKADKEAKAAAKLAEAEKSGA